MRKKVKKSLISYSKRNLIFRRILRRLLFIYRRIKYLQYYIVNKTDDKIIVFEAYMGRNYACSPKAIFETIMKDPKYKDYKFVWAFKKTSDYLFMNEFKNITLVKYGGKQYYKNYSKAKYWITNSRLPEHIIKRKDQVYIQCWHGTPLKRLGHDIITNTKNALNTKKELLKKYDNDAKRYNYMLSPSEFCSKKFESAFNLKELHKNNIIIEKGYPRNDFLYNYEEKDVDRIKNELNIPKNKKVILYAPTWRDDQHTTGVGYTYKTEVNFEYLKEKLSNDYIILFRAHYFVANTFDFEQYNKFVYDVSNIDDINDLYIISDVLITDYSSVFFDYANLKRPMIFYMYDLDYYEKDLRGFYIDLDELPGDIVKEEKNIVDILKNIEKYNKKHSTKYSKFNKKYNYLDDGKASSRVIEKAIK
ncbi:MAG: CDP-glycerol glycerophosphotransferase family protein [Bacilli bacterium]|nr:CDP-glycerol glycerophosphotransferase family protein [Bacilli bacterium]